MISVIVVDTSKKIHTEIKDVQKMSQVQLNKIVLKAIDTYIENYKEEQDEQTPEEV